MKAYLEHPGQIFGLLWAFWIFAALAFSVLCISLSFLSKCARFAYRISRALLWGTIPLLIIFALAVHFDPGDDDMKEFGWLGLVASCLPSILSLLALVTSRTKISSTDGSNPRNRVAATVLLSSGLAVCIGLLIYLLWQSFWLKKSVDHLADQAGASQAMSEFRRGRLVLWGTVRTNDTVRFSGRHDGPFEVWFDEFHSDMPSAWNYAQHRLNQAHNVQMRLMMQHPERFRAEMQSIRKESSDEAEAVTRRFAEALARFDVVPMVEELHPDLQQVCYQMAVHIAETTEQESERKDLLKALGVESLDALRKLTPKAATVTFYQFAFSYAPDPAKKSSLESEIKIAGSLVEGDMVHVLYRSEADVPELGMSLRVPSVVTLKRFDGKLKVVSTTQFESMKAKLEGDGK